MTKSNRGFTFVEVAITVVIFVILALTSVGGYRITVRKAVVTEGLHFLQQIKDHEDLVMAFSGTDPSTQQFDYTNGEVKEHEFEYALEKSVLSTDKNKYFKSFMIEKKKDAGDTNDGYVAYAYYREGGELNGNKIATVSITGGTEKQFVTATEWH